MVHEPNDHPAKRMSIGKGRQQQRVYSRKMTENDNTEMSKCIKSNLISLQDGENANKVIYD